MVETIEINNDMTFYVVVSACRSKVSKRLFVKLGEYNKGGTVIAPGDYGVIDVKEVEF